MLSTVLHVAFEHFFMVNYKNDKPYDIMYCETWLKICWTAVRYFMAQKIYHLIFSGNVYSA